MEILIASTIAIGTLSSIIFIIIWVVTLIHVLDAGCRRLNSLNNSPILLLISTLWLLGIFTGYLFRGIG